MLTTIEKSERLKLRNIEAQPNLKLRPNTWITLVWKNNRICAVADQSSGSWMPLTALPERNTLGVRLAKTLGYVCLALAALQAIMLGSAAQHFVTKQGPTGISFIAAGILLMLMPAALWVIRTGYDTGEGIDFKKRQLPKW